MNLLLDTHALLWWLDDSPSLRGDAREAIANPANTVFVSAVVAWEIRIKQAIGKLDLPDDFAETLSNEQFSELPLRISHADRLADLPMLHRDPFDRMLVAQAMVEGLTLVTRDADISKYGVPLLLA